MQRADGGLCVSGGGIFQRDRHGGNEFQLPGSFVPGALLDNGPVATALIHQAMGGTMPGRTTFAVRNGTVQSADVSLTMTQSASTVAPGSNLTYTLTAARRFMATKRDHDERDVTTCCRRDEHAGFGDAVAGLGVHRNHDTDGCDLGSVANAGAGDG